MSGTNDMLATITGYGGDPADLPFWEGCEQGRFLLHRCGICGTHYWPASRCIEHGDQDMAWVDAAGRATLYTYTIIHHAYTADMKGKVPYVAAVVKLDEGPFFHCNLLDCPNDEVEIGMVLEAVMTEHSSGLTIPVFRPV